jgi:hypothetical protein
MKYEKSEKLKEDKQQDLYFSKKVMEESHKYYNNINTRP